MLSKTGFMSSQKREKGLVVLLDTLDPPQFSIVYYVDFLRISSVYEVEQWKLGL